MDHEEIWKRWAALDELRGVAVVAMVLAPLLIFASVPIWVKHASSGLYLADLVLPVFLFSMGVAYRISFERRRRVETAEQLLRSYLLRYGMLMLFGLLGEIVVYQEMRWRWSVLEGIGLAGILVFPMLFLSAKMRVTLAIALPLLWQAMLSLGYQSVALRYDLGGPLATLAWCSIVLAGTLVAEAREKACERRFLVKMVISALCLSGFSSLFFPVSKLLVTLPYVGIGIGFPALLLLGLVAKQERRGAWKVLAAFGKNPLLIYILSGIEWLIVKSTCPPSLEPMEVFAVLAAAVLVFGLIACYLDVRRVYLKA
jgi:predicted acyltransferase